MDRKTPLYASHVALGGKMVSFAGYLLPIQYGTGLIAEHMAVRTHAGLFDVSHMAEIILSGPDALKNVNLLLTAQCADLTPGAVKYSPMCNTAGGVVDDLMVYCMQPDSYLLVCNAANHDKDVAWIASHLNGDVKMDDASSRIAQLALQGPNAKSILKKCCDGPLPEKYYTFYQNVPVHTPSGDVLCLISQTGYTGEMGYELYCASEDAVALWQALLTAGQGCGLLPCGLGARDTLRLEASMPLYGHELDEEHTPRESGIGFFVKMDKDDFYGKDAIAAKGKPAVRRVGLKMTGRGIAREHSQVYIGDRLVGEVTSGTHCPYLGYAVAMAYLPADDAVVGNTVEIDIRGRRVSAEIVKMPFYKRTESTSK